MTVIRGRLGGHPFLIELDARAEETVRMILRQLPYRGEAIHAMWSGPLILSHIANVRAMPVENARTFLAAGQVVYHPFHFELGIAYDTTQFREPIGSVYVSGLGRITQGFDQINAIGRNLQQTGAQALLLENE